MISWLFEVDTIKMSTKNVSYMGNEYMRSVIPKSFNGIDLKLDISGNNLIAPNKLTFEVSNANELYTITDFTDKFCIVRLIVDDEQIKVYKFKIKRVVEYYKKFICYCVDFLQDTLKGDYPNTPSPKEVWPSDDADSDEVELGEKSGYCIPVIFGTAYIPVRSVNTGTDRHYILGASGPDYTVYEVKSPHRWPNSSVWTRASYTMDQTTDSGFELLQPIIADSDEDGVVDASGFWRSGDTFFDMLCKFSRSDTAFMTNPAECIGFVLLDFGVNSTDFGTASFTAANASYNDDSIFFNGGLWQKENRESVLSNMLAHVDSYISCTDKVELHRFSKTSQEIINRVHLQSFKSIPVTKHENDSGRVHWPESDMPQDVLTGKTVVPIEIGGTTDTPSATILKCGFFSGQSENAQRAGMLYFQKKFGQKHRFTFSTTLTSLLSKETIAPGQVITIDNTLYGDTTDLIITGMKINPDLKVDFTGVSI